MSCFVITETVFVAWGLVGLDSTELFFGVEAAFGGDVAVFDGTVAFQCRG